MLRGTFNCPERVRSAVAASIYAGDHSRSDLRLGLFGIEQKTLQRPRTWLSKKCHGNWR